MALDDGTILTIAGTPASALDADLIPATYVGSYGSILVMIGSSEDNYLGVLTPQGTNDPENSDSWQTLKMTDMIELDASFTSSSGFVNVVNRVFGCVRTFSYFRLRMTEYTSGIAVGTLQLFKNGLPGFQLQTIYARLADAPSSQVGLVSNDGTMYATVVAGEEDDTVIRDGYGFLSHVLVTEVGINALTIYNNNEDGSGDIVGIVKAADAAILGSITECKAPCNIGITIKGNASNPGVTVFFCPR